MNGNMRNQSTTTGNLQKAAAAIGVVFLLVGILGFVPGITTPYGDLEVAGPGSGAQLLGIFEVSVLHNIVHLLFGVAGLVMARTWESARLYLVGGGAIYLLLFVYGLVINEESKANFVPFNSADNWLHLALGLGMVALGVALARRREVHAPGRTM